MSLGILNRNCPLCGSEYPRESEKFQEFEEGRQSRRKGKVAVFLRLEDLEPNFYCCRECAKKIRFFDKNCSLFLHNF